MSNNFIKFKGKLLKIRVMKSLLLGAACGFTAGGVWLMLSRLAVIPFEPITSLLVGGLMLLLGAGVGWLVFRTTDLSLAKKLDADFALHEKAQTMVAYKDSDSEMLLLQRQDAERTLGDISLKSFKDKYFFIYPILAAVGALAVLAAFLVPDMRNYEPPEQVVPFDLTDMQRAGIEELIGYVNSSEMEEPYRTEISDELGRLLSTLEHTETQPAMQAALAETMAYIMTATYDSSSVTEIANALWDAEDEYTQMLARVINTSSWREPDWGDYAEKYSELRALYEHETKDGEVAAPTDDELLSELEWKLQNSALKINSSLSGSGVPSDDALYSALDAFVNLEGEDSVPGIKVLGEKIKTLSYTDALSELYRTFDAMTEAIYAAISQQKINANVGEYTMTKLSTMFLVPLPGFERPDFVKNGDAGVSGSDSGGKDDKDESQSQGGGVGTGATYGSKDLVLDPLTGEYVEYGTLLSKYYAVMSAKLSSGNYTEQQKEAIIKYFDLLYGGIKKDEGN